MESPIGCGIPRYLWASDRVSFSLADRRFSEYRISNRLGSSRGHLLGGSLNYAQFRGICRQGIPAGYCLPAAYFLVRLVSR